MADSKISALPASTTPLAGSEVLPIVQSGTTKQVSVSDLTAGRAISATQITLTAGNVIPASGYGIDFSATPGTGTSELFADYEEGTWTPSIAGSWTNVGTPTLTGTYTKIGRQVTIFLKIAPATSIKATTGLSTITGFPYAPIASGVAGGNQTDDNALGYVSPALATGSGGTIYMQTTGVLTYALYASLTYFV